MNGFAWWCLTVAHDYPGQTVYGPLWSSQDAATALMKKIAPDYPVGVVGADVATLWRWVGSQWAQVNRTGPIAPPGGWQHP